LLPSKNFNTESLISIVIPFYKDLFKLVRALESIKRSIISKHAEVIVIDDFSKENITKSLKKFESFFFNFIILRNKKNMGASFSRNLGLKISKSRYIFFLDHDDEIIIKNKSIINIFKEKKYKTILLASKRDYPPYTNIKDISDIKIFNFHSFIKFLTKKISFNEIWNFIFYKKFLIENQITFKKQSACEDLIFILNVYFFKPKIFIFKDHFVRHNYSPLGLSKNKKNVFLGFLKANFYLSIFYKNSKSKFLRQFYLEESYRIKKYIYFYNIYSLLEKDDCLLKKSIKKKIMIFIHNNMHIFKKKNLVIYGGDIVSEVIKKVFSILKINYFCIIDDNPHITDKKIINLQSFKEKNNIYLKKFYFCLCFIKESNEKIVEKKLKELKIKKNRILKVNI